MKSEQHQKRSGEVQSTNINTGLESWKLLPKFRGLYIVIAKYGPVDTIRNEIKNTRKHKPALKVNLVAS